jgi:hypothetical protein
MTDMNSVSDITMRSYKRRLSSKGLQNKAKSQSENDTQLHAHSSSLKSEAQHHGPPQASKRNKLRSVLRALLLEY